MPIYFYPIKSNVPFMIETIGYDWLQEPIVRKNGHPCYHWLQTTTGAGTITINHEKHLLNQGQGILISPFVPHSYQSLTTESWYTNFVTITGKFTIYLSEILGESSFYLAEDYTDFSFSTWLKKSARDLEQQVAYPTNELAAYNFLMQIQAYTHRYQTQTHPLFETYVHPLLEWIEECYDQNLTLSKASQFIYLSPQYINRLFNRFLGSSFQQYLFKLRMRKAKELLVQHAELKVMDIAIKVGYQDTSYFIANFKKETGMTPEQFRSLY